MNANRESHKVGYKHQPTVAVGLVGIFLPFEDEPEYHCREERRVAVNLSLDSAEPVSVAPGVGKRAHKARPYDGHNLLCGYCSVVARNELAGEVRDAPEKEKYAAGT